MLRGMARMFLQSMVWAIKKLYWQVRHETPEQSLSGKQKATGAASMKHHESWSICLNQGSIAFSRFSLSELPDKVSTNSANCGSASTWPKFVENSLKFDPKHPSGSSGSSASISGQSMWPLWWHRCFARQDLRWQWRHPWGDRLWAKQNHFEKIEGTRKGKPMCLQMGKGQKGGSYKTSSEWSVCNCENLDQIAPPAGRLPLRPGLSWFFSSWRDVNWDVNDAFTALEWCSSNFRAFSHRWPSWNVLALRGLEDWSIDHRAKLSGWIRSHIV